jgi:hypothetical protein
MATLSIEKLLLGLAQDKEVIALTVDPSVSGFAAPIGSLGLYNSGGTGQLWIKTGAGDTDWAEAGSGGGGGGGTTTNILTGGSRKLVDIIEVGAATQSVSFGAGGDGNLGTALNGDEDGLYLIEGLWVKGVAATTFIRLEPNGLGTDQEITRVAWENGISQGSAQAADLDLAVVDTSFTIGAVIAFSALFYAKSGTFRPLRSQQFAVDTGIQSSLTFSAGGWTDTASVVTSLDIVADQAGGIDANSVFRLYKLDDSLSQDVSITGPLEFVDIIEVTGAPAVGGVLFGAGGDGEFQRALNGDLDEEYILSVYWPKADLTLRSLEIYPNDVDPGAAATWDRLNDNGGAVSGSGGTGFTIASYGTLATGTGVIVAGTAVIQAKTGGKRSLVFDGSAANIGGTDSSGGHKVSSVWHDDSTNITSMRIIDPSADLPVGTRLVLWRRRAVNGNQDSDLVARTQLGSDSTTLVLTGLNGDLDEEYEINGKIRLTTSINNLLISTNGGGTIRSRTVVNGIDQGTDLTGIILVSSAVGSRNEFSFKGRLFFARSLDGNTVVPSIVLEGTHCFDLGDNINSQLVNACIESIVSNITTMTFTSSVASGILAGSYVEIRRL